MKKFLIILCILMMLPIYSFAAKSPTIEKTINCEPALMFNSAEKMPEWETVLLRLEVFNEIMSDFILLDAFKVYLDYRYNEVEWTLSIPIDTSYELQVLMIDAEVVYFQNAIITPKGTVIINLNQYEPGVYYICFYIKME